MYQINRARSREAVDVCNEPPTSPSPSPQPLLPLLLPPGPEIVIGVLVHARDETLLRK